MLLGQTKWIGSVVGAGRISVVLPCLNESEFTIQTVQSFCNRTGRELKSQFAVINVVVLEVKDVNLMVTQCMYRRVVLEP